MGDLVDRTRMAATVDEAAYRRGALIDKRRSLMGDWAGYLAGRL